MAKWADLLSNKSLYPDDFTVSVKRDGKEETLSLGEMRAYDSESRGALTADLTRREQEMAKREKQVNDASIAIGTVVEKVASASGLTVQELLEGKQPTRKQVAAAAELDESDPLVGSLVKEIKGLRAELGATKGEIESVKKSALGPMLNTYLEDYYESKWDKLQSTLPKGSKVTRDEALKYAQDNGYKDSRGRFDLSKAIKDLTYDERVVIEAEKRVADLRKKDDDARVLAAAPRPSSLGTRIKTDKSLTNEKGQTKNFDEVLNDALADSDLWRSVQGGQA
jgi:hypothetical protein